MKVKSLIIVILSCLSLAVSAHADALYGNACQAMGYSAETYTTTAGCNTCTCSDCYYYKDGAKYIENPASCTCTIKACSGFTTGTEHDSDLNKAKGVAGHLTVCAVNPATSVWYTRVELIEILLTSQQRIDALEKKVANLQKQMKYDKYIRKVRDFCLQTCMSNVTNSANGCLKRCYKSRPACR